jgi:hypothetical protein
MAGPASDYQRGQQEIGEQVSTYHLVMGLTKWGSLAIAVLLLFFSLWFATGIGFMGAAAWSIVLLVGGILFLREKKNPAH